MLCFCIALTLSFAQDTKSSKKQNQVKQKSAKTEKPVPPPPPGEKYKDKNGVERYLMVEKMPDVVGGMESILAKITYPELAKKAGVQGKVYIKAFIDENGNVEEAKVMKGIGSGCDEQALNAVLASKFTPGLIKNKPVKTEVVVPVVFKLK